jgi:non-ribosomal peptide synthetase component F
VVRRQEALRTVFEERDGEPFQRVEELRPVPLPLVDLASLPRELREREARRTVTADSALAFDLKRWPLMRCLLLRLDRAEHVLSLVTHHIISDGWSLVVMIRDLVVAYIALAAGGIPFRRELPAQYRDFVAWQKGLDLDEQRAYWRRKLAGVPTFIDLPADHPRPPVQSFRGAQESFTLGEELTEGIRRLSREEEGLSHFVILLTAFQCVIGHLCGQDDFVISTPVSYRNRAEFEDLVGFFVSMLLLRADLSGDPEVRELLSRVRGAMEEAYAHQDVPLEMVIQEVAPSRELSYSPLLQLAANFIHRDLGGVAALSDLAGAAGSAVASGLEIEEFESDYASAVAELVLVVSYNGLVMNGSLHYRVELFDRATIRSWLDDFQLVLEMIVRERGIRLSEIRRRLGARDEARRAREREKARMASARSLKESRRKAHVG